MPRRVGYCLTDAGMCVKNVVLIWRPTLPFPTVTPRASDSPNSLSDSELKGGDSSVRRSNTLNREMWQFAAVVTFFVAVLLAAYWYMFVPRRTPDELLDRERRKDPGRESWGADRPRPEASPGKPEKSGARAGR